MSEALKEKANEISLMLVMTSEGDTAGIGLVLDLCSDLSNLAAKVAGYEAIVDSVRFLNSKKDSPEIFGLLQEFSNGAGRFLDNDKSAALPGLTKQATTDGVSASSAEIDTRFLAEFIENHTVLLEDFEANLLDQEVHGGDGANLATKVKGYLHNLKGDAGAIGLNDIGMVCHTFEDLLTQNSILDLVTPLLVFKQWMTQCFSCYAEGDFKSGQAEKFLKGIEQLGGYASKQQLAPEVKQQAPAVPLTVATKSPDVSPREYTLSGEREIIVEFASEAEEHLNNLESIILDAEGNYNKDAIDTIFRGVHSIKGGSAYFNIEEMTKCSHILENFLSEVRDGKRELDATLSGLLLTYIDLQKDVLVRTKDVGMKTGKMTRSDKSIDFMAQLEAYASGAPQAKTVPTTNVSTVVTNAPANSAAALAPTGSPKTTGKGASDGESDAKSEKLNVKNFVKVDTARLDVLIDSIGEMVIYSSMLIRHCRELLHDNESVMDATHRVEKFTRDLQDIGMSMRLVPIKGLFQKMSRLVWDTSKKLGKEIVFTMEGEDTELDRNLIDKLADPLMHMVRNSLDHGIETPDEREKKGRPRTGQVKLSAYHSGGSIHIKIQDDGKGLDPQKLLAKAIEKGIVDPGQKLTESEVFQLIFAAGFSTAAVVTDISGRGVGMDVVRRNVESLRGRIHIESKVDEGSTFTIELPLTLAIIDGIQVQVGTESFLIPSLSVVEFIRPKKDMISNALDQGETLHFRGKYLPIYRIADLYGITPTFENPLDATIAIVETNNEQVALVVDDILGECSTVIKSLGAMFEEGKGLAGCAIMPKGNVALILDVRSLIKLARSEYRRVATHSTSSALALLN